MPGTDGVETTLALTRDCPSVAVVCLTASASPRELDALVAAGAIERLRKDQERTSRLGDPLRRRVPAGDHVQNTAVGRRLHRRLSGCPDPLSEHARRPAVRPLGERELPRLRRARPARLLRAAGEWRPSCAPRRSGRRGTSLSIYTVLAGVRADVLDGISPGSRGRSRRPACGRRDGRRPVPPDRRGVGVGRIAMLAIRVQELLATGDDGRGDRATGATPPRRGRACSSRSTPQFRAKGGRIGRARALGGNLLNVKPSPDDQDGKVVPLARARGRQKALEEFRKRFEAATSDGPGLAVGIAHAEARRRSTAAEIVLASRPQAGDRAGDEPRRRRRHACRAGNRRFFWFPSGA